MIRGEALYRLQDLDDELDAGQQRVAEIQADLGETEELRQAQANVQETARSSKRGEVKKQPAPPKRRDGLVVSAHQGQMDAPAVDDDPIQDAGAARGVGQPGGVDDGQRQR